MMLGEDSSLVDVKTRLIETTSGNPFFIEQMLKSLLDEKIVIGEKGAYSLNPKYLNEKVHLPESIYAVILASVDRLSVLEKAEIQRSSVIGQNFSYALCTELLFDADPKLLRESFNVLQNKNFIYETKVFPELEFAFCHMLLQEIIYSSVLKAQRKAWHAKLTKSIEKLYLKQLDEYLEALAIHAFHGELWEKAFEYCTKAADKAFFLGGHKESIPLYEKALEAAQNIAQSPDISSRRIENHLAISVACLRLGRIAETKIQLEQAMQLAIQMQDERQQSGIMAAQSLMLSNNVEALKLAEQSNEMAVKSQDIEAILTAQSCLLVECNALGQYAKGFEIGKKFFSIIPHVDFESKYLRTKLWFLAFYILGLMEIAVGNFAFLAEKEEELLSMIKTRPPGVTLTFVTAILGLYYLAIGKLQEAIPFFSKTLQLAQDFQVGLSISIAAAGIGYCQLVQGINTGKEYIDFAIKNSGKSAYSLRWIGEALLFMGDERAESFLSEAIETVTKRNMRGERAHLLRIAAAVGLKAEKPDVVKIKQQITEAIQLSEELGMMPNLLLSQQILAQLKG
jgi:tetratricopeptide (TPR) repeat protein